MDKGDIVTAKDANYIQELEKLWQMLAVAHRKLLHGMAPEEYRKFIEQMSKLAQLKYSLKLEKEEVNALSSTPPNRIDGNAMVTDFGPFMEMSWMKDGPVPPVDPAELKSVWAKQEEFKKSLPPRSAPDESLCVSVDFYKQACGPGADVGAVWYRLSMLELLKAASEAGGPTLPGLTEGKTEDAVFKALA